MEGRKCNTLPFAELLFLSFPSRHFHFEHPKRAFSLDGEVKKEKKKKHGQGKLVLREKQDNMHTPIVHTRS